MNGGNFIQVRPNEIVINEAQTFEHPTNSNFDTTWTTANTIVEVAFNASGIPSGVVTVGGDHTGGFDRTFSSGGTGGHDFEMRYNDGFTGLAANEPLQLLKYNIFTVDDFTAANNIPNTLVNGSVNVTETTQITSNLGPIDFLGGVDAADNGGIAIDFGDSENLTVTVDSTPTIAEADFFVFNMLSSELQAWDIDVIGDLGSEGAELFIPFDPTEVTNPELLKVYHFDETAGKWELLSTRIEGNTLVASTDNFSPVVAVQATDEEANELLQSLNATGIPEPGSLALILLGLCGLVSVRGRRLNH